MTVSSTIRRAGPFLGDGVTTTFPFAFKAFAPEDVRVTLTDPDGNETTLTLDSDYSVSLDPDQENSPGGSVLYPIAGAPAPNGWRVTLTGSLPYMQTTDITNMGGFYPQVIEDSLDRCVIQIQQLAERADRAVQVPVSSDTSPEQLIDQLVQAAADSQIAAGQALASKNAAALSESNAATSESNAHDSELAAALSESNAHDSELAAALSASNAATSEGNAATSASNAHDSELAAAASEAAAKTYLETLVQPFAFMKADYDTPCLKKTGAQTVSIKAGTVVVVSNVARAFPADTAVTMPGTLTAGEDYSVWVKADGTAVAVVDSFLAPASAPAVGAVRIGGFHYGLVTAGETVAGGSFATSGVTAGGGSMAWTQTDVDRIAGINEFSLWDLAFRCAGEQYGMAYDPWADVWVAIYFCSTAPHVNGISRYNTDVASGTVLAYVPPSFGGDGVLKYSAFRSWEANEICLDHGLRLIRYEEFVSAAFGVTEGQSLGGASATIPATLRQPGYTSRIGLEQATGHAYTIGGPMIGAGGSAWSGNGRGSNYGGGYAQYFGGGRADTSNSGSRCVVFSDGLGHSVWNISLRAAGDPQKTVGPALYQEAA